MIIALDYDHTFTEDPVAWLEIAQLLRARGHTVYGVTMRYGHEAVSMNPKFREACDDVFFTGRCAKKPFMISHGIDIGVWIDDNPSWIYNDAR